MNKRNKDRYKFLRAVEGHLGRRVCGIWRIEWKPRESGYEKGIVVPHFHFLLFDVPYLDHAVIRNIWRSVLHRKGALSTDVRRAKGRKQTCVYIAKYIAKVPVGASLDIASYLNIHGRHYGFVRKSMIPRHEVRILKVLTDEMIDYLSNVGIEQLPHLIPDHPESFTLIGEIADKVSSILLEMDVDK